MFLKTGSGMFENSPIVAAAGSLSAGLPAFRSPDADAQIGDILFSCRRGPADKFVIGPAALRHIGKIHRHTFCKFRLIKLFPDLPEFSLSAFRIGTG